MEVGEAAKLIQGAVAGKGGTWADLGAGEGTFTQALAGLLGPEARIYAIDHDPAAVRALSRWAAADARVIPLEADFRRLDAIPALRGVTLDGVLLANSLHFAADPARLLARIARLVRPGGRLVVVEYDRRPSSRWVPYPVSEERLRELLPAAGFTKPQVVGTRPSRYSGMLYAAVALRPGDP
ncbi:MAG TPA: class I SAM-dependent methyltransferase [Longimicrobiaceae bacterium]|nr:class I SAM-dependent methyltransferase [Longimicrobiaceae bacterium]